MAGTGTWVLRVNRIPVLTCPLHQGLIARGERLSCRGWAGERAHQRGWAPEASRPAACSR